MYNIYYTYIQHIITQSSLILKLKIKIKLKTKSTPKTYKINTLKTLTF